ncbi:G-type lectin S-receptor-like serine/threonine-protein kinase At5g35370 [Asparagus officinalis]|uniref:G-type lectin S-receptor-like serine/threonine-protein kinase At5g35370 n=1 Tax=Asparagus officinalis TaxID=4686 RepID=UPI00098E0A23|nr:G-type lectin S-receptor-like serine/threonine-protein kinase At5g35370 [Asparagus officinalis]
MAEQQQSVPGGVARDGRVQGGKMDANGKFRVVTYGSRAGLTARFVAPSDSLRAAVLLCACFRRDDWVPCLASPSSCARSNISYLSLESGISYFANNFAAPLDGDEFDSCRDTCSNNCSCLAFFYKNSSKACYLIHDQIGSLIQGSSKSAIGYVKTIRTSTSSSSPAPSSTGKSSSTNIIPILLPLVATSLLVIVLAFVGFQWWRRKGKKEGPRVRFKSPMREIKLGHRSSSGVDEFSDSEEISIPGLPTRFSSDELELATNAFQTLIGSGGFGSVYKGELPDGSLIAVKKITNIGLQGKREFCTEIAVIGNIHHVNLVKLRGFCVQGSNRMLVYEYMNMGSLDRPLFGHGPVLEWQERLEIAIGAARGLAYLHFGCDQKILHCDIKPENILLADHGQVKIADFGMAKLMTPEQSGLFTTMRGTRGYLAPEWLTNSAISDKTDVYSYGMVLLEIVRGRKNRCTPSAGSEFSGSSGSSVEYFPIVAVERHMEGRWSELADPRMEGRVTESEVSRAVKVALCCLHEEPWMRPSMAVVVGMLEGTMAVWEPKVEGLKFLRVYGRGGGETEAGGGGEGNYSGSGSSGASASLLTFISSQEVSGPR